MLVSLCMASFEMLLSAVLTGPCSCMALPLIVTCCATQAHQQGHAICTMVHLHDLVTDLDRAAEEDVARQRDSHTTRVELLQHCALLEGAYCPAAAWHHGESGHQHLCEQPLSLMLVMQQQLNFSCIFSADIMAQQQ